MTQRATARQWYETYHPSWAFGIGGVVLVGHILVRLHSMDSERLTVWLSSTDALGVAVAFLLWAILHKVSLLAAQVHELTVIKEAIFVDEGGALDMPLIWRIKSWPREQ